MRKTGYLSLGSVGVGQDLFTSLLEGGNRSVGTAAGEFCEVNGDRIVHAVDCVECIV